MKLGQETIAKIAGTALDTAPEMDALIELARVDRRIAERLIGESVAGEAISAVAQFWRLPGKDKERARQKALELFPGAHALLARKKDHGRAEAALIALYGIRNSRVIAAPPGAQTGSIESTQYEEVKL
jgi:hypothetical protein